MITRHSLIQSRLVSIFGSEMNGSCSSIDEGNGSPRRVTCNGTSVLNDGHIPSLDGVSSNLTSLWAAELFTMRRPGDAGRIIAWIIERGL